MISCDTCGEEFETRIPEYEGKELIYQTSCNTCIEERRNLEIRKLREEENNRIAQVTEDKWAVESGMFGKFCECEFDNFDSKLQEKAFNTISKLNWKEESLILSSPNLFGVGKTHLVHALINNIIRSEEKLIIRNGYTKSRSVPVKIVSENKMLAEIRRTYNNSDKSDEDIYESLEKPTLLIIDDVGKVAPQNYNFLQSVYFRVIDDRYNSEKQVILTTNLNFNELEKHIGGSCADRLREMCGKNFITMKGESYRRLKKK